MFSQVYALLLCRCTKLEQKLSSMADLELEGDPDLYMDEEISPSPSSADLTLSDSSAIPRSSSSTGLQQVRVHPFVTVSSSSFNTMIMILSEEESICHEVHTIKANHRSGSIHTTVLLYTL